MLYPTLTEQPTTRKMVDTFRGYNHNLRIGTGEFYDMENITSTNYPVLSPRGIRGVYASPKSAQGMIAKDSLCYVDGADFVINEYHVNMGLSTEAKDCPKTLISMGAYVIIMPDKKYINTADITDFGNIEASVTTGTTVSFELCKLDGSSYSDVTVSPTEPSSPENMAIWLDTSTTPNVLKQFSETSGAWVAIATTYIKISATGIGAPFEVYDGVNISGVENAALQSLNSNMIIQAKGDDYIVVIGILDSVVTQTSAVTVKRQMPNMDFITEAGNRLWGCRYGVAVNGEVVNEIYASKLGDFKNWNCYMGLSTDSYAASCGTDGPFTGAITHLGYPIFFKEGFLHKVYGNYPANFQIQSTACRGVQQGCEKSLAIVNEVLYYKARSAVCAYDGSLPTEMSTALGEVQYGAAVAGAHGNKYYISMADGSGVYHLFVYDTLKGMWHREDNTRADAFCSCQGEMYFIDHADGKIKTVLGSGTPAEEKVEWMAETGVLGTDSPDKKYISRITFRMALELGAKVYIDAQYDSSGVWERLSSMTGTTLRSFAVPVRPKRCDHLKIRLSGEGDAKIYSFVKTVEQGSDF